MGCNIKGPYALADVVAVGGTVSAAGKNVGIGVAASATDKLTVKSEGDNSAINVLLNATQTADGVIINGNGAITSGRALLVYGNAFTGGSPIVAQQNNAAGTGAVITASTGGHGAGLSITTTGDGCDIQLAGKASAGVAAGTAGGIYYNTTTGKLMVREAAGWKTVTTS